MSGGGGGSRSTSQLLMLSPNLPKNLNSIVWGRGIGPLPNFWVQIYVKCKLPWVQIYVKCKLPMSGGGGGVGQLPNFWSWVQICLKPKLPVFIGWREAGKLPNLLCWVQFCLNQNFLFLEWGSWLSNFWYWVQICLKPKFPISKRNWVVLDVMTMWDIWWDFRPKLKKKLTFFSTQLWVSALQIFSLQRLTTDTQC